MAGGSRASRYVVTRAMPSQERAHRENGDKADVDDLMCGPAMFVDVLLCGLCSCPGFPIRMLVLCVMCLHTSWPCVCFSFLFFFLFSFSFFFSVFLLKAASIHPIHHGVPQALFMPHPCS